MVDHPLYTYRGYYLLLGIPGIILSLFAPFFQTIYVIVFFLLNINLLFERDNDEYDLQHGSTTHFVIHSRHNQLNYAIAFITVAEAALIATRLINPAVLTFLAWTVNVFIFSILLLRAEYNMALRLIVDYIAKQGLSIPRGTITTICRILIENPEEENIEIASSLQLDVEVIKEVRHYFQAYTRNNGLL